MPISKSLVYPRTHRFQIPVMGSGHSVDTPLRVARFGISSVVSLVDDIMVEQVHRLHTQRRGLPFQAVPVTAPDARVQRVRNYFDFLWDEVRAQLDEMRAQEFAPGTDKTRYFEMLPETSPLKVDYLRMLSMPQGSARDALAEILSQRMEAGSIDANIMTKLDRRPVAKDGTERDAMLSDAKTALRGFALSRNQGNMVFSAGINPTLFGLMEEFPDFYRTAEGEPKKGIIIKVSDFRSAMVQGRFLAKKGLEVREFRIESGLNCGGHAFASEGDLLGPIVDEFRKHRDNFPGEFAPHIENWFRRKGREVPAGTREHEAAVAIQGGLGNSGEQRRMIEGFGADATGWGTPFMLVPEATPIDDRTRELLRRARAEDLYLSEASPLGVPFNNLRTSTAALELRRHIEAGKPGSACPKGFLVSNTEFSEHPICTASAKYQAQKLAQIGGMEAEGAASVLAKECICHQLGNGALAFIAQENRILKGEPPQESNAPVSICPGPNLAWFDRIYSLSEMVDHIYGRTPSIVPAERPHCFAAELEMNVKDYQKLVVKGAKDPAIAAKAERTRKTLLESIAWYREFLATTTAYGDENLASLATALDSQESLLLPAAEPVTAA
jgi:hypothetical protein